MIFFYGFDGSNSKYWIIVEIWPSFFFFYKSINYIFDFFP